MPLDEPSWWYLPKRSLVARALSPLARLYAWRAAARLTRRAPYRSRLPVVCVGNFTAGGTGKTPLSIHLAHRLLTLGERPAFLTRGYGGRHAGPHWVDPERDSAADVGDEPLLLARHAPTLIARDRRAGAIAIEGSENDPTVIVMDDGLQNPALAKDLSIAIVDGVRGVGNGEVIPAGPLRLPLDVQLHLADAILVNLPPLAGDATAAETRADILRERLRRDFPGPVLAARTEPVGDLDWLRRQPLLAYAGIANPDRFFAAIERCGGSIAARVAYKDHHAFTDAEAAALLDRATALGALLVTTEKDLARLARSGAARQHLMQATRTFAIGLTVSPEEAARLDELLIAALQTGGYRARIGRP